MIWFDFLFTIKSSSVMDEYIPLIMAVLLVNSCSVPAIVGLVSPTYSVYLLSNEHAHCWTGLYLEV